MQANDSRLQKLTTYSIAIIYLLLKSYTKSKKKN